MATIYDIPVDEFISALSEELKKIDYIKPPAWAGFVKTGAGREKPPVNPSWWYIRAASMLRKIYILGPIGVSKLRVKYGNKANCGMAPERFYKGSGSIIRKLLQQFEKAELAKQDTIKMHKGRVLTKKGKSMMDKLAARLSKSHAAPHKIEAEEPKK